MRKTILLLLALSTLFVTPGFSSGSGNLVKNKLTDQGFMFAGNSNSDSIIGASVPSEIEDPELLGINKEAAHATLMVYASQAEAIKANRLASSFCMSLNGAWKFNYVTRPEFRPVDFYKPSFDVTSWKEIQVPSNWQVLGYGQTSKT